MDDLTGNSKPIFKDKWVFIIGILAISFVAPFIYNEYNSGLLSLKSLLSILGSLITTLIMWLGVKAIVIYLGENFPWQKNPMKHLIIEIIAILLYTSMVGLFFFIINAIHPIESFEKNLSLSIFFTLMITFFNTSIYEGWYFFMQWKETLTKTEKLEKENIKSQYETLKSQINPHFLFNNLNTLASLIEENPKIAVDYVQKTADYYRNILFLKDKEIITIEEELELIKTFFNLQSNRYGDNLKVNINIPSNQLFNFVAPLTLQMLVENAIKHNIISKDKPLTISIFTNNNAIIVSNNFQKRDLEQASNKFGLKNICDRYSFLTSKKVEIIENESNFTVSIPILTM
ncbi:MAG: histidine kinase [Bacteroidales bacterium]|nr:histidine kinase [Bacteroidales bacterium]